MKYREVRDTIYCNVQRAFTETDSDNGPRARAQAARAISEAPLRDLIETGEMRYKDERRIWIAKHYGNRADNLLCMAAVLETALVVKPVMHHFSWGA